MTAAPMPATMRPSPTSAPHIHAGQPRGSNPISRNAFGGVVGVAASITRLNQPGPASISTAGVASTVADGSANARTAASIEGSVSRTTPPSPDTDTAST
ncbi:hypothetical protein [Mycobacteroides franklinii]|uniref:hypothetical protein n=1 Tax=Mycobacteroides franklinii TaxID=948102 RepID=UPI003013B3A3